MNYKYVKVTDNSAYSKLKSALEEFYGEDAEVVYVSDTTTNFIGSMIFRINKFSTKYIRIATSSKWGEREISFGDSLSSNKQNILNPTYFAGKLSDENSWNTTAYKSMSILCMEDSICIIIKCSNSTSNCLIGGIAKATDNKFYAYGYVGGNDSGIYNSPNKYTCVYNITDDINDNYALPLGNPRYSGNYNNEDDKLELHKIQLLNSNLKPLTDSDGNNIYFNNLYGSIGVYDDSILFPNRGLITPKVSLQERIMFTARSLYIKLD